MSRRRDDNYPVRRGRRVRAGSYVRQYYNGTLMVMMCVCVRVRVRQCECDGGRTLNGTRTARSLDGDWTTVAAAVATDRRSAIPTPHSAFRLAARPPGPAWTWPAPANGWAATARTPTLPRSRSPTPQCLRCSFIIMCVCVCVCWFFFFFILFFPILFYWNTDGRRAECTRRLSRAATAIIANK